MAFKLLACFRFFFAPLRETVSSIYQYVSSCGAARRRPAQLAAYSVTLPA
jgi:hypothetical protein